MRTAINTKRHFFAEPIDDLEEKMKEAEFLWKKQQEEQIQKIKQEEVEKKQIKKRNKKRSASYDGNRRYLDNFVIEESKEVQQWVIKIAKQIEREGLDFYQMLNGYDMDGDGLITPREIEMVLKKIEPG